MDLRFNRSMYSSFVKYQSRLIGVFDRLAKAYDIEMIDASRPPDEIFHDLQNSIGRLFVPERIPGSRPALTARKRKTYNKVQS